MNKVTTESSTCKHVNGDTVESVKSRLHDPVAVCEALHLMVGARRQTRGLMIRCRSGKHQDTTPSCSVTQTDEGQIRVVCFACGLKGDVLTLIKCATGLESFAEVLKVAREIADTTMEMSTPPDTIEPLGAAEFHELAETIVAHGQLVDEPDVAKYLAARGLLEEAVADGWGALPIAARMGKILVPVFRTHGEQSWVKSGMASDTGITWTEHRVVIPWCDPSGQILTLQRRLVSEDPSAPKYVSPKGRQFAWPYGVDKLPDGAPLAIVEGAIDTLSLRALLRREQIERGVIGIPGTRGWREDWAHLASGRDVFIAVDADEAGDLVATEIARDVKRAGAKSLCRVRPRDARDWNDALCRELKKDG
jgi:DNA primase